MNAGDEWTLGTLHEHLSDQLNRVESNAVTVHQAMRDDFKGLHDLVLQFHEKTNHRLDLIETAQAESHRLQEKRRYNTSQVIAIISVVLLALSVAFTVVLELWVK